MQAARQRQIVSAALAEAVVGSVLRCEAAVAPADGSALPETLRWSPWAGTVEQVADGSLVVRWMGSLSPELDPEASNLYRAVQIQRPPPALIKSKAVGALGGRENRQLSNTSVKPQTIHQAAIHQAATHQQ